MTSIPTFIDPTTGETVRPFADLDDATLRLVFDFDATVEVDEDEVRDLDAILADFAENPFG